MFISWDLYSSLKNNSYVFHLSLTDLTIISYPKPILESTLFPVGYHHSFNDNTATTKQVQPNHQGDITAAANSLLQLAKPDINTTSSRSNIIISKKPLKCHNHDTISVSTYPPRKSPIIIISRSTSPILGDTRSNNTSPVPMTKTANEAKPSLQTSAPTIEQPAVGSRSQSPIGGGGSSGMDIDVLKSTNLSLERIRLLSTALYTCATNNIEELYRNRRTSSSPTPTSQ